MVEPEKPFACSMPDCGMTFTNEDHLHVHTKKHDMMLQLGSEQKAAFVADQTPTPTRFIRNCEEVGLFQDLTVNPFEEGFKRAMETYKHGSLLESTPTSTSDDLHTPQMVFPMIDPGDSTLYTSNNQRNITISRSSSDESGTIKEYETTTISKLTNEVTTISRIVNKHDVIDKIHADDVINKDDIRQKDVHNETSVSFTNNVIKIHNNIEIRKDNLINVETAKVVPSIMYTDSVIKDSNNVTTKDVLLTDGAKNELPKVPPMMSQKSLDFVVDCLTSDLCRDEIKKPAPKPKTRKVTKPKSPVTPKSDTKEDYEVIIKLPNGKQVRMKAVEELNQDKGKNIEDDTKEKLKLAINNKVSQKQPVIQRIPSINTQIPTILPISTGTLIPVTIVTSNNAQILQKVPIAPFNPLQKPNQEFKKTVKRKNDRISSDDDKNKTVDDDDVIIIDEDEAQSKRSREDLNSRVAASRRYRVRLRETMRRQVSEINQLKETNQRLSEEKAVLQLLITEHMKHCPNADHLRTTQEKLSTQPRS
ncbi:uncharacterized protein LOC114351755 [Ostrinia furnacalis]|uniref:uncharacterized protein LOC114351755 n=1 Tax=Ostrinia furnacalis TaxID=93504 RepID=UPI001039DF6E|nr:uncharacterized protein LOC114351755 [Ostrinia furnacalis]